MKVRELPPEAIAALEQGRKIEAIKIVRAGRGLDLKASKELVESYMRSRPELEERLKSGGLPAIWFWLLLLVAAAGLYWFSR